MIVSLDRYDSSMTRHRRPGLGRRARLRVVVISAAAIGLAISTAGAATSHPKDANANTLYNSMREAPRSLDPGVVYGGGSTILMDIVEAPLQYNYLGRPHKLEPLLASEMPTRRFENVVYDGNTYRCPVYTIRLKKGVKYQPHPCFVAESRKLTDGQLRGISTIKDFKKTASREMTAYDFVYGLRRLGDYRILFPVYSLFSDHLLGFDDFSRALTDRLKPIRAARTRAAGPEYKPWKDDVVMSFPLDYNQGADKYPFVRKVDRYTFELVGVGTQIDKNAPDTIKGEDEYPQIVYWMTYGFFAPVPHEAVEFFNQPGLRKKGITFDINPVGTGPYMVETFDPNSGIVLTRNPNFRDERYPTLARPEANDEEAVANYERMKANGMLANAGKRLPLIDRIVFRIELEPAKRWEKFLRGEYESSGILVEQFDRMISRNSRGEMHLTDSMAKRGLRLLQTTTASLAYDIFNMGDPVVGGYGDKARKLRQAISIAIDTREEIDVFNNGMALEAQGPIPPGIFGYLPGKAGINPQVFDWDPAAKRPVRKSIEEAKKLLAEAGYPGGLDANGKPLSIDYVTYHVSPQASSGLMLLRKQLQRINVRLDTTQLSYNEYHKRVVAGDYQLAPQGWAADYPDPETFLILFHKISDPFGQPVWGPRYDNAEYEALYRRMCPMPNGPERLAVIQKMVAILRKDAPVVFKRHGIATSLNHGWLKNYYPYPLTMGMDKYLRIDVAARAAYRRKHSAPLISGGNDL